MGCRSFMGIPDTNFQFFLYIFVVSYCVQSLVINLKLLKMRKLFAILVVTIVASTTSFAQDKGCFEKGTNVINVGIGVGDVYWGAGYGSYGLPVSLNLSYEHGI